MELVRSSLSIPSGLPCVTVRSAPASTFSGPAQRSLPLWHLGVLFRSHYPGRLNGACSLVSLHPQRPSLCNSQVGSCIYFFGACSAFTRVMACTLAESPCDPLHRRLRQLRCLCCRFDCYRVERTSSRAGVAPAEVQRLFTAHCHANYPRIGKKRRSGWRPTDRKSTRLNSS